MLALLPGDASHGDRPGAGRARPNGAAIAQTCRRDQSGIQWTLPFDAARARATAEKRLLFVKPIAFGTSPDGGW